MSAQYQQALCNQCAKALRRPAAILPPATVQCRAGARPVKPPAALAGGRGPPMDNGHDLSSIFGQQYPYRLSETVLIATGRVNAFPVVPSDLADKLLRHFTVILLNIIALEVSRVKHGAARISRSRRLSNSKKF
jgi:hypothetical protein